MKQLSEMKIAKEAILSEMEASSKGGVRVGTGTNYYGPSNPSSISTYVDGMYWGSDGSEGSLFGDSWSAAFNALNEAGQLQIKKQ